MGMVNGSVWKISIYDRNWRTLNVDFHKYKDREQAELRAESDCDWLGGAHWEVEKIR